MKIIKFSILAFVLLLLGVSISTFWWPFKNIEYNNFYEIYSTMIVTSVQSHIYFGLFIASVALSVVLVWFLLANMFANVKWVFIRYILWIGIITLFSIVIGMICLLELTILH